MNSFKPFADKLIVKVHPKKEKTDSGLYIPDSAAQQLREGTIVDIGEGKYAEQTGVFMPTRLKAGQVVSFYEGVGLDMTVNEQEVVLMTESDIIYFQE
jgi:chaperonin GroES